MDPDATQDIVQRLLRAQSLLDAGEVDQALIELEPSLASPYADGWILATQASLISRQYDQARQFLRRAREMGTQDLLDPNRARHLEVLRCGVGLYLARPMPGPGLAGLIGALLRRRPAPEHPSSGQPIDDARVEEICQRLHQLGRADLLYELLQPRAESLFPGLSRQVRSQLQALGLELPDSVEPDFVFIGGAGRSGTTLFRTMLDAHHRISCGPELKLIPAISELRDAWWRNMGKTLSAAGLDEDRLDQSVRAFILTLLQDSPAHRCGLRIAEKTPHNILHMKLLGRLFPQARFIHLIRDGRAVVSSLLNQDWHAHGQGGLASICQDHKTAAAYWRQIVQTARQDAEQLPGRYLEIRYEALVESPRRVMEEVLAFLGEAWDERVLEHHIGVQTSARESSSKAVAAPVHKQAIHKWKEELSADEIAGIEVQAGALLRSLGYPVNQPG